MPRSHTPSFLERATDRAIRNMDRYEVGSEEYMKSLDIAVTLYELKMKEKPSTVSKDVLAVIGANLLGIFMIIQHEHVNVITSKALNLVMKPRV